MLLLLLLEEIIPVTSRDATAQVVSFRKLRTKNNGLVRCVLDEPSETSSFEDCSLKCALDDTCTGFNDKGSENCDVYNYKVKLSVPVSTCTHYQVIRSVVQGGIALITFRVFLRFCFSQ